MRTKSFDNIEIVDADRGEVAAVFATFNVVDHDNDVTRKSAIADGAPTAIGAFNHETWKGALPVGKGRIVTTDTEAIMKGRFFMDTPHGAATFATVKGMLDDADGAGDGGLEWSYGLVNVKAEKGTFEGKAVNFLNSIDVPEVCPVLKGAGINTRTLAVKGAKFSEQADTVLADVDELIARATEVVALRAEKGKTIAAESVELLSRLDASMERLKALLVDPTPDTTPDDLEREFARFVALSQGVTS